MVLTTYFEHVTTIMLQCANLSRPFLTFLVDTCSTALVQPVVPCCDSVVGIGSHCFGLLRLARLAGLEVKYLERLNMVRYAPGQLFNRSENLENNWRISKICSVEHP